jgi:deleted-in-malignant-brain-tumors protein 1
VSSADGVWGTVCDYGWDRNDALVVCNQLGTYTTLDSVVAVKNAYFGEGNGLVWIGNVKCNGTENRIEDCPFDSRPQQNCGHDQDAGVICRRSMCSSRYQFSVNMIESC